MPCTNQMESLNKSMFALREAQIKTLRCSVNLRLSILTKLLAMVDHMGFGCLTLFPISGELVTKSPGDVNRDPRWVIRSHQWGHLQWWEWVPFSTVPLFKMSKASAMKCFISIHASHFPSRKSSFRAPHYNKNLNTNHNSWLWQKCRHN